MQQTVHLGWSFWTCLVAACRPVGVGVVLRCGPLLSAAWSAVLVSSCGMCLAFTTCGQRPPPHVGQRPARVLNCCQWCSEPALRCCGGGSGPHVGDPVHCLRAAVRNSVACSCGTGASGLSVCRTHGRSRVFATVLTTARASGGMFLPPRSPFSSVFSSRGRFHLGSTSSR